LINPFGWMMLATNRAGRSLLIAMMIAPIVVLGYFLGLSHGPQGVAAGFSITTVLLVLPVIIWATRGTSITPIDTFRVVMRPVLAILLGTGITLASWSFIHLLISPILRLLAANAVLFSVYGLVLWFVMGQKTIYLSLLREIGILRPNRTAQKTPKSKVEVSE
jgi:hypothetical protein